MYSRLPNAAAIKPFNRAALDVVDVESAIAKIREYIDTPVDIIGVAVHYLLLVIEELAFFFFSHIEILRPDGVMFAFDESVPVRL